MKAQLSNKWFNINQSVIIDDKNVNLNLLNRYYENTGRRYNNLRSASISPWYSKIRVAKSILKYYHSLSCDEDIMNEVFSALNRYIDCVPLSKTTLIPNPFENRYRKLRRSCNLLSMCPFCQLRMQKAVYEFIGNSNYTFCKHSYLLNLSEYSNYDIKNDTVVSKANQIVLQIKDFIKNNQLQPAIYYAYKYHNAVDLKLYNFVYYAAQRKEAVHILDKKYSDIIVEREVVPGLTKWNVSEKDTDQVKEQIDLHHIGSDFLEVLQFSKFKKPFRLMLKK